MDNDKTSKIDQITNIKFYLRENDKFLCKLYVENDHLQVDYDKDIDPVEREELQNYFDDNREDLESLTLQVSTGGQLKDEQGNPTGMWDGVKDMTIEDGDEFIPVLFLNLSRKHKKDKLNMKYIISAERTDGMTLMPTE